MMKVMTKVEIEKEALALSEPDRLKLANALVESVVPFSLSESEQAKADQAIAAYRANPEDVIPAEEVHRKVGDLLA